MRYEFGANWADYIKHQFNEERLEISRQHLLSFMKLKDLTGLTFLDIGCGSGMHSLAAFRSGAARVVSIDYDQDSVNTTRFLHQYAGSPANWEIRQGSVLDEQLMSSLGSFDIVYSWGVLHHTGDMWNAIRRASLPIARNGVFYIALYTTDVYIDPTPEYWLMTKQKYNKSGSVGRKLMEISYAYDLYRGSGDGPFEHLKKIGEYKKSRGMSYWTDIKDWLGGWPMEFAGIRETKEFGKDVLGLELLNIIAGPGNTEYLFRKNGAVNYWDEFMRDKKIINLTGPFVKGKDHCWSVKLPDMVSQSDSAEHPGRSTMMLYEDGVPSGFAHAPLQHIETYGNSRYCHSGDTLYFSSTDNSDPNTNGRVYAYAMDVMG